MFSLLLPTRRFRMAALLALSASASTLLSGCSAGFFQNADGEIHGGAIQGIAMGGEQPLIGTRIYMYAAGTSGYGTFSRSMLTTTGGYVATTGTDGHFSITGDYTCQTGDQVYLVAQGGNPGLSDPNASNPAIMLMAALGTCTSLKQSDFIVINEVTTVAAAYALSGFLTSPTALASSGTTLAKQGVANAFLTAANIVAVAGGQARTATPAGNGVVPQAEINTLADIIAACVNSDGTASACSNLFASTPNATGVVPTNVGQALINLAHAPGQSAAAVYSLITAYTPFVPVLSSAPKDWTMAVQYTGGGINGANSLAIDAVGNVWVGNQQSVTELDPTGAPLSPATGFTGGALTTYAVAGNYTGSVSISPTGQVWTSIYDNNANYEAHIVVLDASGNVLNGSDGYTAGIPGALGVFDPSGKYWNVSSASDNGTFTNNVEVFGGNLFTLASTTTPTVPMGTLTSPTDGYTGGGLGSSYAMASDMNGNIWSANLYSYNFTTKAYTETASLFTNAGVAKSPSTGYALPQFATGIAIDRTNNAWLGFSKISGVGSANALFKYNSSGTLLSPTAGFSVTTDNTEDTAVDGDNRVWWLSYSTATGVPNAIGVATNAGVEQSPTGGFQNPALNSVSVLRPDLSGNIWVTNLGSYNSTTKTYSNSSVDQFVGLASPTVAPLSYAVAHGSLGTRP